MQPVKEPTPKSPTLTVGKINLIRHHVWWATQEAFLCKTPVTIIRRIRPLTRTINLINQVRSH